MQERDKFARRVIVNINFIWPIMVTLLFIAVGLYVVSRKAYINNSRSYGTSKADIHSDFERLRATAQEPIKPHEISNNVNTERRDTENETITYRGVSFIYNASLASKIEAETKPAYTLQYDTDTGQGVVPEHIVFELVGAYASQHKLSFFPPKIAIYPIADYKKTLNKSKSYVQQFENKIQTLRTMLSEQPNTWEKEIPFLPFGIGASQGLRARVKYLNFQNGRGVMFLTQYNIEPVLINNQGLTYTFQGLTDDGVYYVSATFPVTASFLPEGYDSERAEDYELIPPQSYQGYEFESFENAYNNYLVKVTTRLEHLSPDSYQPDLRLFENLIRSLSVKPS